jgi:hypothetical protein
MRHDYPRPRAWTWGGIIGSSLIGLALGLAVTWQF